MSKGEMIQRLEQLLERVRTRAAEPRAALRQAASEPASKAVPKTELAPIAQRTPAPPAVLPPAVLPEPVLREHDSEERLVAAQSEPPEETTVVIAAPAHDSIPPIEVTEIDVVDEEEEAPVSSRRTVASEPEEGLAELAFGGEEPREPLHTPPPESGRLPSAPVSDFDPDITGVRSAAPAAPDRSEEDTGRRELVAEAVRPDLPPSDTVAEIVFAAQNFAPSTFVALLDASLRL